MKRQRDGDTPARGGAVVIGPGTRIHGGTGPGGGVEIRGGDGGEPGKPGKPGRVVLGGVEVEIGRGYHRRAAVAARALDVLGVKGGDLRDGTGEQRWRRLGREIGEAYVAGTMHGGDTAASTAAALADLLDREAVAGALGVPVASSRPEADRTAAACALAELCVVHAGPDGRPVGIEAVAREVAAGIAALVNQGGSFGAERATAALVALLDRHLLADLGAEVLDGLEPFGGAASAAPADDNDEGRGER
jgi:hypothetical protein